jgi:hypothetical protein
LASENERSYFVFFNIVTITYGSDVTGFDAVRVGRVMPRAPAAAEFLPAVRNSQVLQQVVNGKGLALVIRMIGLSDESIIFIIDVGKNF